MRFRFCCTCEDEEIVTKGNGARSSEAPPTVLPAVITQQPKHEEPIELDSRNPGISIDKTSAQATKETVTPILEIVKQKPSIPPKPAPEPIPQEMSIPEPEIAKSKEEVSPSVEELYRTIIQLLAEKSSPAQKPYIPPVTQSDARVSPESKITVDTTIGDEKLNFRPIAPDFFQGTFKGSQFHIINGRLIDYHLAFNETDKAAINSVYNKVMESMKECQKGLESGISLFNSQDEQVLNLPPGSTLNTNYFTRSGEKAVMTFKPIGQGQFRSTYKGIEFTISNKRIVTTDGDFDDQDHELIWRIYNETLTGMQQGLLGVKMGMLGQQMNAIGGSSSAFALTAQGGTAFSGVSMGEMSTGGTAYASTGVGGTAVAGITMDGKAVAQSSFNVLATGRETLKRMRSSNHGKRISLLEEGSVAQPRQPVMVIEDITENPKKPCFLDDTDAGKLSEPVLQKTTFTPNAIIYQDPKTFEQLDKNELPVAKRLDDYIISVDENFNSANRFHFHEARPRRVNRKKLHAKENFRLASPERFSLFERECLKAHNEYRKIHGVPPLVHNEFLSQVAKEWAEHLALKDAFYHRPNNEYGENLYYVDGMPCCAKKAVKAWYDEIDLYDYNKPKFSKETGHFTQLVWKDTREVGTGVAQIGDKVWVCCTYHPPGNHLNKFNDEFVPRPLIKRVNRS